MLAQSVMAVEHARLRPLLSYYKVHAKRDNYATFTCNAAFVWRVRSIRWHKAKIFLAVASTNCDHRMTFCWYGPYDDGSDEADAYGRRWTTSDNTEKALEWNTALRCLKSRHLCILARNQALLGSETMTAIDLYDVTEWSDFEIKADSEANRPAHCELNSLLISRPEARVTMLSRPGPHADSKECTVAAAPRTVLYKLEQ